MTPFTEGLPPFTDPFYLTPFTIVVRAFIPYLWSNPEEPLHPILSLIAEGDADENTTRNSITLDDDFGSNNPQIVYRVYQKVILTPYENLHTQGDIVADRQESVAPSSDHHDKLLSVPLADLLKIHGSRWKEGGPSLHKSGPPKIHSKSYEEKVKTPKFIKLNAKASGEDGAFPPVLSSLVPNIDWDIDFQVDASSNPLNPKIRSIGKKDLYPAYEIIAQNSEEDWQEVYFYMPNSLLLPGIGTLNVQHSIDSQDITLD